MAVEARRPWRASRWRDRTHPGQPPAPASWGPETLSSAATAQPRPRLAPSQVPAARGPVPPPARALARFIARSSRTASSPSRPRWRPPGSAPRPERLPHRPHLPNVTRHTDLQLEGREALTRPALRLRGHRRRLSRGQGRVATHRLRAPGAQLLPGRHPGPPGPQVEQCRLHGAESGRGEAAGIERTARSQLAQLGRRPPRGSRRPAATAARPLRALRRHRRRGSAAGPSRAARACRGR